MKITAVRGFNDILPPEAATMRRIEQEAASIFSTYGFSEIRIPVMERTELFSRSIGATTDIVEKEMYTFPDRRGDSMTLRPEGTAPVVRAYIQHKLYTSPCTKLFYTGPMFRYERPQKGRFRQFFQIGAEVLNDASAWVDAETLHMLVVLFERLGVTGTVLQINSLGCPGCRPEYKKELKKFLTNKKDRLCDNCKRRMEENPLRALDCKSTGCVEATTDAPSILEHVCPGCSAHFEEVKGHLKGLGMEFKVSPRMVRGLDYYTRTTFEITAEGLGAQNAVAAGGRYDNLVEELGGPPTPCFGFALGMERLALTLKDNDYGEEGEGGLVVFLALGPEAIKKGRELIGGLRARNIRLEADLTDTPLKGRMKRANRLGARFVLILGEDELKKGGVTIKDMQSAKQEFMTFDELKRWAP